MFAGNLSAIPEKGSFAGNLRDPPRTECSSICGTPVLSDTGVRNAMEKRLLGSSFKKMQQPGAAFLMIKNIRATSQLRDFLYALDNKPFNVLCQFQILFYHVLVLSIKEVTV